MRELSFYTNPVIRVPSTRAVRVACSRRANWSGSVFLWWGVGGGRTGVELGTSVRYGGRGE